MDVTNPADDAPRAFYLAVLLAESSSDVMGYQPLFEEEFVLLEAGSEAEARDKAVQRAGDSGTSYTNAYGETVTWTPARVVDVQQVLYEPLVDGAALYARHFRDRDSYERLVLAPTEASPLE